MAAMKRKASNARDQWASAKKSCAGASRTHSMLTRAVTTAITRNAVLGTQELLVRILRFLPLADLIAFRRVNTHFKAVIDNTPELQTKMFLRSSKTPERQWVCDTKTKTLQPYDPQVGKRLGRDWINRQAVMRPSILNPLLFKTEIEERRPALNYRARICETIRFTRCPDLSRTKFDSIIHSMYVCQPPVQAIEFHIHYNPNKTSRRLDIDSYRYLDSVVRGKVKNSRGVTFGDLIQNLRQAIARDVPNYLPSRGYRVNISDRYQNRISRVWMLGAIFVNDDEKAAVEGKAKMPLTVSPLATKMRYPTFLRDEAKQTDEKKQEELWTVNDWEFAAGVEGDEEEGELIEPKL